MGEERINCRSSTTASAIKSESSEVAGMGVRVATTRFLEPLLESLDLALGVDELLSSRKERMAIRADV